jgi:hypothetical protein
MSSWREGVLNTDCALCLCSAGKHTQYRFFQSKKRFFIPVFLSLLSVCATADTMSRICYATQQLSSNRWQNNYRVENLCLADPIGAPRAIEEFTIWFDCGLYDNITVETLGIQTQNWDEITWQPDPYLNADGAYDALGLNFRILPGESAFWFSVSFNWYGPDRPESQYYEIVNPLDYSTPLDSGLTAVPEPVTLTLLVGGMVGLVLTRRK